MTLESMMNRAAGACLDERERHLVIFTEGANGYVCRNEGLTDESQALFHGTYFDCQIWIERRGIAAALRCILQYIHEVPEFAADSLSTADLLDRLSHLQDLSHLAK